jgi:hypothetical protein
MKLNVYGIFRLPDQRAVELYQWRDDNGISYRVEYIHCTAFITLSGAYAEFIACCNHAAESDNLIERE